MFINIVNINFNKFLFLRKKTILTIFRFLSFLLLCYLNKFDNIVIDKLMIFRFYFLESIKQLSKTRMSIMINEVAGKIIEKISNKLKKQGFKNHEDLSQDVFVIASQSYDDSKGRFETFCFNVMRSVKIDYLRKQAYRKTVTIDNSLDNEDGNNNELQANPTNTMDILKFHLKDAFDNGIINELEHNILSLKALGNNFYEISDLLEISLGSAHGLHSKAIAKMAE